MTFRPACSLFAAVLLVTPTEAVPQGRWDSPQALAREISRLLADPETSNGFWGVAVHDLTRDEEVFRHEAGKSFIPASNTKLYTTASALALLGADFVYETDLLAEGDIVDGVLHGSLVVRGSGDPSIGPRFTGDGTLTFRQWADSLRAAGIRVVEGDIVGDDDVFDDLPLGNGWSWDDEPFWYSAEISGLTYFDNTVDLYVRGIEAGRPAEIRWEPEATTYVEVVNASETLGPGSRLREGYARDRGSNRIRVTTRVPAGDTEIESISVPNPTLYFVHVLREVLIRSGIVVRGMPRDVDALSFEPDYARMRHIARHTSQPLGEVVRVVNKPSQNLYAEQLLRTLGSRLRSEGSAWSGWRAAMPFLSGTGVDTTRIQLVDGSGLSRMNLVTPDMTLALLKAMWSHPEAKVRDAFLLSLPIGGVDGTLASRFTDAPTRTNVRAKTGTLSNASAISGYVTTAGGSTLAFSIMSNHFTVPSSRSRAVQDRIVVAMASYDR